MEFINTYYKWKHEKLVDEITTKGAKAIQEEIDNDIIQIIQKQVEEKLIRTKAVNQIDNDEDLSDDVIEYMASKI